MLLGHLHDLDGLGTDQLAVQELVCQVANAVHHGELLHQGTDTNGASAHDPVVAEVTESDRLAAGLCTGHILGDADLLAQNGVVGLIPEILTGIILEGAQRQSGLIVHEPYAVSAILGLCGEVQADNIIVGQRICSHANIRTAGFCEDTGRHIHAGAVDESVVLGPAEVSGQTLHHIVLQMEGGVIDQSIFHLEEHSQFVIAQRDITKVGHGVRDGNSAALGYPGGNIAAIDGFDAVVGIVDLDKVLFVVDRKDLDYQTMKEYDRFEKGAANSNTSTAVLKRQLEDDGAKIIITTIQKLATFIKKNAGHGVFDKRVVIIFDECHRSQFGDMHLAITRYFKKYHLFGFTGTPIFAANAGVSKKPTLRTTAQAFGDQLHAYTIVDAINDKNVLPFRVDYIKTMDMEEDIDDKEVWDINREKAYLAPERIRLVTEYILTHFDQKTYRGDRTYTYNVLQNIAEVASASGRDAIEEVKRKQRISGFNSIFAVSSVDAAKLYYAEFKRQMEADPTKKLRVAIIYSYGANEEETDGILDEENPEDTSALDAGSREFLEDAIADYNAMFHTNYDTSSDKFQNYYKDVSLRMKNKELDLLIVVNMFLTGFDATTLNTLWVDKNLKMHGLIQAYSRTNRILNSIKTFGNIVCFRNLQKRTDDAISLFGDKEAGGIVLLRGYNDYYYGYTDNDQKEHPGYVDMIEELTTKFPLTDERITGEQNQKEFIMLFGAILRMRNLLSSFDEFAGHEILSERDLQDYLGRYQDLRDEWKNCRPTGAKEDITDDIVFEIELIKQIEINIDYILMLVKKYHDSHCDDKEVLITIQKAIDASPELRSKKALIETFIAGINDVSDVMVEWRQYVAEEKERQLVAIIREENLKEEETRKFIEVAFRDGSVKTTGTDIDKLMPPMSRFGGGSRAEKKQGVIAKLIAFFERFFGIG